MLNSRHKVDIKLGKLVVVETGTYNPMYQRPYQVQIDGHTMNSIVERVATAPGRAVTGALLTGVAGDIVKPSADHLGEIYIPGGFTERRVRFFLEVFVDFVSLGNKVIYYFQGYTDVPGVDTAGNIDPHMNFIINSFVGVRRSEQHTPHGVVYRDVVSETSQVLADPNWQNAMMGGSMMMRPQDIFLGMQTNYMEQGYEYLRDSGNVVNAVSQVKREPARSSRKNNVAANYVASIVDAYGVANELAQYGNGKESILSRAVTNVYEDPLSDNPFIRMLSDRKGMGTVGRFNYRDLIDIDPNIVHQVTVSLIGPATRIPTHYTGMSEYWNGTTNTTVMATMLTQTVPSIMMDLMLQGVHFYATNRDITGATTINFANEPKSLCTGDMTRHFKLFKHRMNHEVLRDLSFNNMDSYTLDMRVDLFGDTTITLSLNGEPPVTFVAPSFCDNLFVPVVTTSQDLFGQTVHLFDTLCNNVVEASVGTNFHAANAML